MNTLNAPVTNPVDRALLKMLTGTFMILIAATACIFIWMYVSMAFLVNGLPDNQLKVIGWSAAGVMSWAMLFAGTIIVARLGCKKSGEYPVRNIFILTFYMTFGVGLCYTLAYAATVFAHGTMMLIIVSVATTGAVAALWYGFRLCHKCWLGAKLP